MAHQQQGVHNSSEEGRITHQLCYATRDTQGETAVQLTRRYGLTSTRGDQADLHVIGKLTEDALLMPVLAALVLAAIERHDAMAHLLWYFAVINRILQGAAPVRAVLGQE